MTYIKTPQQEAGYNLRDAFQTRCYRISHMVSEPAYRISVPALQLICTFPFFRKPEWAYTHADIRFHTSGIPTLIQVYSIQEIHHTCNRLSSQILIYFFFFAFKEISNGFKYCIGALTGFKNRAHLRIIKTSSISDLFTIAVTSQVLPFLKKFFRYLHNFVLICRNYSAKITEEYSDFQISTGILFRNLI